MRRVFLSIFTFGAACIFLSCAKQEGTAVTPTPINGSLYKTYLALGDSYTIGQSVPASDRFPAQTINILGRDSIRFNAPEYIAVTGWTTRDLINAINTSRPSKPVYDFVTLLIGVNNQYQGRSQQEYTAEFNALLAAAIKYAGNNPKRVAVLSIPDWSVTPFANGHNKVLIASQIDSFNVINKRLALENSVNYIDITPLTRMAATDLSLIATDGLHPSGTAYTSWALLLAALMKVNL